MSSSPVADGSSPTDAPPDVEIDPSDSTDSWRFVCPNGHRNWSPTNNHIWCQSCRRQIEAGADLEAEHYELHDRKTDETIPWSSITIAEPEQPVPTP